MEKKQKPEQLMYSDAVITVCLTSSVLGDGQLSELRNLLERSLKSLQLYKTQTTMISSVKELTPTDTVLVKLQNRYELNIVSGDDGNAG